MRKRGQSENGRGAYPRIKNLLKNSFFFRLIKNAQMQGAQILRSEAYLNVRCNDEG